MAAKKGIDKRRDYNGPAILERGYRPFFFLAGLWALIPLTLWILIYLSHISPVTDIDAQAWHAHEMIFGYGGAAMAGFALTAIPNWTGRLPVRGTRLLMLVLLWLSARLLMLAALFIDSLFIAAIVEAIFMIAFSTLVFREVLVGKNWRNLPVAVIFTLFGLAAITSNLERLNLVEFISSDRIAIAMLVMLISLIGGRIIPSFTQSWLKQMGQSKLPVAFNDSDKVILLVTAATLISWLSLPVGHAAVTLSTTSSFILHLWRVSRWCGIQCIREPLVLMLHIAYIWIPIGFGFVALSSLDLVSESAVIHSWSTGAIASMTLAVMMRATLGHSGRALKASMPTTLIFAFVTLAAISRVIAASMSSHDALIISAASWGLAYTLYIFTYSSIFWRAKG